MRSAALNPFDLPLEVVDHAQEVGVAALPRPLLVSDVPLDVLQPTFEGSCVGLAQSNPDERTDQHHDHHAKRVTHPASLPPDLAERLRREQFIESQGDEVERAFRRGWNRRATSLLRETP